MIRLYITHKLKSDDLGELKKPLHLINSRRLTNAEVRIAREKGIKKVYLPSLTESLSHKFLNQFDQFWDRLSERFDQNHFFWRNAISSKMQEWEESAGYLTLKLFTLNEHEEVIEGTLISICCSIEEEKIWEDWGRVHGWQVLRRKSKLLGRIGQRIFQEARNSCRFIYLVLICLYYKLLAPPYALKADTGNNKTVLINSLLYAESFEDNNYRDPFFGRLHQFLEANDIQCIYLCHPLGKFRETLKQIKQCKDTHIIVPYTLLSWAKIIGVALKLYFRRVRLNDTYFSKCDFSGVLNWNARRFDFFFNFHSEITFVANSVLIQREKFEKLIHLYEGNVFERASMQAFKNHGKKIGYSHGVVFLQNLKLRITKKEILQRPMFDEIICVGPLYKKILCDVGGYDPNTLYRGCSLRSIPQLQLGSTDSKNTSYLLIALDGVMGSAHVLDWLLENAAAFESYHVVIRTHPNVPIDSLKSHCLNLWPKGNFAVSKQSLQEDLEKSFCVIYRQTSVGLQAMMNGIPAVHLRINAPLSCDPIIHFDSYKWHAESIDELMGCIKEIESLSKEQKQALGQDAAMYAERYFTTQNDDTMAVFIKH